MQVSLIDSSGEAAYDFNTSPVNGTYPFGSWPASLFLIDRQQLTIPPDLPAGVYSLTVGLLDDSGNQLYGVSLGSLEVEASQRNFDLPEMSEVVGAQLGEQIALLGANRGVLDDERVQLSLIWQAASQPVDDYTAFVHVLNPDGTCCAWQQDSLPGGGQYPTSLWLPGEVIVDDYFLSLPQSVAADSLEIEVGLYRAETGERLPVSIPGLPTSDAIRLAPLSLPAGQ